MCLTILENVSRYAQVLTKKNFNKNNSGKLQNEKINTHTYNSFIKFAVREKFFFPNKKRSVNMVVKEKKRDAKCERLLLQIAWDK